MAGKKILFLSKGEQAVSTRYRALPYFPYLQQQGWAPSHFSLQAAARSFPRLLQEARRAQVVVVLRQCLAFPWFFMLRRAARKLVLDIDDAVFANSNGTANSARYKRFARMASACDQVWAGNNYLAQHAAAFSASVRVLPTVIDSSHYAPRIKKLDDSLTLVWIGSRSSGKYLQNIMPTLESLAGELPHLRLKVISDFSVPSFCMPILFVPWRASTENKELATSDVGIAPLPENSWTLGKCGLKVLQYMAAGLPVVASPVGVQCEMVQPNENGFLVEGLEEWRHALCVIARNSQLCWEMGLNGRRLVEEKFAVSSVFPKMLDGLEILAA